MVTENVFLRTMRRLENADRLDPAVRVADRATRRVGVVHAAANLAATLIFLASWAARTRDRHGLGVGLARAGGALLIIGGFLGGYIGRARRP